MSLETHALHGTSSAANGTPTMIGPRPTPSDTGHPLPGVFGDSKSGLKAEVHKLLKIRLRAVAIFCLVGSICFLLGQSVITISASYTNHPILWWINGAIILAFAGVWGFLLSAKDPTLRTLRVVEAVTFCILCVFLWSLLYFETWDMGHQPAEKWIYITNIGAPWMIAVFGYSLFIPNSWRRTLLINSLLTLIPVATLSIMMVSDENVRNMFRRSNFEHLLFDFVLILGAATYGSWLMNSMHKEVVEARQLGQYKLIRKLGGGGMGEVYLAEHQMLKRPCAVKIIRPGKSAEDSDNLVKRFKREVHNMAQLSHWNTVEVYDFGVQDGTFYYAMEYLPGWTLHDLVDQFGPMPPDRVIHLLRQTCDALYEAHTFGLLHRDIKPGNIVVSKRGGVCDVSKLLDFGLVKKLGEDTKLTQDGIVSGTPHYMSPEQATGRDVDCRSDLYSLGAVGYFLLTGQPPFNQAEAMQILISHARDPVTPLSDLREGMPFDLEQIILRCLAKRPEDRYDNARALEAALAKCKDASKWTQIRAREWWDKNEPTAPTQPIQEGYLATTTNAEQAWAGEK